MLNKGAVCKVLVNPIFESLGDTTENKAGGLLLQAKNNAETAARQRRRRKNKGHLIIVAKYGRRLKKRAGYGCTSP